MATVLITGANRGIGLELARQYKSRGDHVIAACRKSSDALSALDVKVHAGVDVSNDYAMEVLDQALGQTRIDILINNAGVLSRETLDDLDFNRIRTQLEINALGPLRVTNALRKRLGKGSKVAIITSRMGSIDDNTSGGMYGYRMSKAAVNMAGVSLAHDLASDEIAVALLHPGMVATEMTGGRGISTEESANGLMARIDALDLESSGTFWHAQGEVLPW